jgi:hypothetical protein
MWYMPMHIAGRASYVLDSLYCFLYMKIFFCFKKQARLLSFFLGGGVMIAFYGLAFLNKNN